MVTIKDFKAGDTAYTLLPNRGRRTRPEIEEVIVTLVGRKYVTVNQEQKYEDLGSDYLIEVIDYGEKRMLFLSRKDINEYMEKRELMLWLGSLNPYTLEKYSYEQLKKVAEILGKE